MVVRVKKSIDEHIFDAFNILFMIVLMVIMVYPLLNVLAISLSAPELVSAGDITFYPKEITFEAYKYILADSQLYIGFFNTILYAAVGTLLTLTLTSLAAYSLAVPDFVLKKFFVIFLTITMFFGGGLIPTYLLIRNLGLLNTFAVMVLPGCVGAWTCFIFRAFFQALPTSLRESAFIDGANDFTIWRVITVPLSKPIFATYGLFTIVGHWNSWFNALMYLQDMNKYPLQMYLRRIVIDGDVAGGMYTDSAGGALIMSGIVNPENIKMAVIIVTIIPILCIYPFIQKYFVKGVMIGAIKG